MLSKENKNARPTDILETKFWVPTIHPSTVYRPRLMDLFPAGVHRRLILLTAPTGYGKTTLVSQWIQQNRAANCQTIWINLDQFDNSPARFFNYLYAGFARQLPELECDVVFQDGVDLDQALRQQLTCLINLLARRQKNIILVLDDFQHITHPHLLQWLTFFINHQPENLTIIFSSRKQIPIAFARLRARGELLELGPADLRFNLSETLELFNRLPGLQIDSHTAANLVQVTEGWAAGLQLAGLSIQKGGARRISEGSFPGGISQVSDYLIEEVLTNQRPEIRDFLLQTCLFDDFSPELSDATLGIENSRKLIHEIDQANLFIIPLDSSGTWFRYHTLFGGALRNMAGDPGMRVEFHRNACAWLQEHGYLQRAIIHAIGAADVHKTAELINQYSYRAIQDFKLADLIEWIDFLPADVLIKNPDILLHDCLANFLLDNLQPIEPKLRFLERELGLSSPAEAEKNGHGSTYWNIRALRGCVQSKTGQYAASIENGQAALASGQISGGITPGLINYWQAEAHDALRELPQAEKYFREAGVISGRSPEWVYAVYNQSCLARILKQEGRLKDAELELKSALDLANNKGLELKTIRYLESGLAEISMEKGDLESSAKFFNPLIDDIDNEEISGMYWRYDILFKLRLVRFLTLMGESDQAELQMQIVREMIRSHSDECFLRPVEWVDAEVRLAMAKGKTLNCLNEISALIDKNANPEFPYFAERCAALKLKILVGGEDGLINRLEECEVFARAHSGGERMIELLLLRSLACQQAGRMEDAAGCLLDAFRKAHPEGWVTIFGEYLEPLKTIAGMVAGEDAEFQRFYNELSLLPAIPLPVRKQQVEKGPAIHPSAITVGTEVYFSPREWVVFRQMMTGKQGKEIAATLMISISTVKTHMQRIYRKMGIHTRRQFFTRVRELRLEEKSNQLP
jgi:LuxR family maltose regulon positive regulatory protein